MRMVKCIDSVEDAQVERVEPSQGPADGRHHAHGEWSPLCLTPTSSRACWAQSSACALDGCRQA